MAEWTGWYGFDGAESLNRMTGWVDWNNPQNSLASPNFAIASMTANASSDESDYLNWYNPLCAPFVPFGATINTLEVRIQVDGWNLSEDSGTGGVGLKGLAFGQGLEFIVDRAIPFMTPTTWTYSKTRDDWGLTQQEAEDFLYAGSSNNAFRIWTYLRYGNFTSSRCYYAECRVNFTRPPNVPRSDFIVRL